MRSILWYFYGTQLIMGGAVEAPPMNLNRFVSKAEIELGSLVWLWSNYKILTSSSDSNPICTHFFRARAELELWVSSPNGPELFKFSHRALFEPKLQRPFYTTFAFLEHPNLYYSVFAKFKLKIGLN